MAFAAGQMISNSACIAARNDLLEGQLAGGIVEETLVQNAKAIRRMCENWKSQAVCPYSSDHCQLGLHGSISERKRQRQRCCVLQSQELLEMERVRAAAACHRQ